MVEMSRYWELEAVGYIINIKKVGTVHAFILMFSWFSLLLDHPGAPVQGIVSQTVNGSSHHN